MKNRNEILGFLNGLVNGNKTLQELKPANYKIVIAGNGEPSKFYKNDIEISQEEHSEAISKMKKPIKITVTPPTGI